MPSRCASSKDVDEIVHHSASPVPGGVNLEDIWLLAASIEDKLKACCDIPIFHDDQHGTPSYSAIDQCSESGRQAKDNIRVVISSAGAAAIAISVCFWPAV